MLYSFFLIIILLSHQNLPSFLLLRNKRDRLETLIEFAEWSQFVVMQLLCS